MSGTRHHTEKVIEPKILFFRLFAADDPCVPAAVLPRESHAID